MLNSFFSSVQYRFTLVNIDDLMDLISTSSPVETEFTLYGLFGALSS